MARGTILAELYGAQGGGDAAQALVKALQENTRETSAVSKVFSRSINGMAAGGAIGGPAGAALGAIGGFSSGAFDATLGRAINTAESITATFAANASQDFVQRAVRFGSGPGANAINSFVEAGTKIPIIGGLVQNGARPFEAARQRLGAIVGSIEAGGGSVTDDSLAQSASFLIAQEQRRREGQRRVDEKFETDPGISAQRGASVARELARGINNFRSSGASAVIRRFAGDFAEAAAAPFNGGEALNGGLSTSVSMYLARFLGD